jgi:hypothetical protein
MLKIVLLLAIIVIAALLARRAFKISAAKHDPQSAAGGAAAMPPDAELVRCVACGAFVPKAEALPAGSGFRCGGAGCANPR